MHKQNRFDIILLILALLIAIGAVCAVLLKSAAHINDRSTDSVYTGADVEPFTEDVQPPPDTDTEPSTEPVVGDTEAPDVTELPAETATAPVTEPATEPVTEPPEPEEKVISVLACGDNLLYRPNTFEADELAVDGKRSYMFTYENVAELIASADIAFINQETLLCGGNVGYPQFNSPFEVAETLAELGFDIANIATNHMLDVGYWYDYEQKLNFSTGEGIAVSRNTLENNGLTVIGGYLNEDDFKNIRVYEYQGVKIAFLAFTESTNTITLYPDSDIYIPYLTEENVKTAVALAKEAADLIIVSAHWGVDSSSAVAESQLYFAQLFADLGVDAVIGHHSHIIHPIEWIEGKDGNKMLCAYSLGNFIGMMEYPLTVLGGILTFDIRVIDGEKPIVENIGFVPTLYNYDENYRNNKIYFLEDYNDEMIKNHGVLSRYEHEFSMEELNAYIEKTIAVEFIRSKNDY